MRKVLTRQFFERPAERVARELLGMYLVRRSGKKEDAFKIIETEAYVGPHDLAAHSSRGRTKRTEVMFGPAGRFYVYFVYGVHWMLNIVTEREGYPAAVLIRGVEGAIGPGRLTKRLDITGLLNGARSARESGLWIEDRGDRSAPRSIKKTPRIGVAYAGEIWANKKLRFLLSSPSSGAAASRQTRARG